MRAKKIRLSAWTKKFLGSSVSLAIPVFLMSGGPAAFGGTIGTIYTGNPPGDLKELCKESKTCPIDGVQEVWYGADQSWIYKLMSGSVYCENATFTDPRWGKTKKCFSRDATMAEVLPPRLNELPLSFDLNNLLTVENKRYVFSVHDGSTRRVISANSPSVVLRPLPAVPPSMPQNYFQFDITDGANPIRQYSIFISPTFTRCSTFKLTGESTAVGSTGRIMEVYAMTTLPAMQVVPQRTDVQRICTNDKGQLKFHLKPPSIDSFQVKIVNYGAAGNPNDVFNMFIPTNLEWSTPQ